MKVTISAEAIKELRYLTSTRDFSIAEAVELAVHVGVGRQRALDANTARVKREAKAKGAAKKSAAKKSAKKPAAKKAAAKKGAAKPTKKVSKPAAKKPAKKPAKPKAAKQAKQPKSIEPAAVAAE